MARAMARVEMGTDYIPTLEVPDSLTSNLLPSPLSLSSPLLVVSYTLSPPLARSLFLSLFLSLARFLSGLSVAPPLP
eukprot:1111831-Amorphochlora_amoeboformis.AAC.1